MKTLARILSFYFLILIAIPAIKVVKSQLESNCSAICHKENRSVNPKGCQKGKCILNFNFGTGQFIVQQIQSVSFNTDFEIADKDNLSYEKVFIANYKNIIWHPPKSDSFA
jgi:hypothetical protein